MPLHCWNYTTLERVAKLWGTLEAYGENVKHTLNCEKVSLLVTTNQVKKIEVQVGSMNYIISVVESGFCDISGKTLPLKNTSKDSGIGDQGLESQLDCSSEESEKSSPIMPNSSERIIDDIYCFGNDCNDVEDISNAELARQLNVDEILGGEINAPAHSMENAKGETGPNKKHACLVEGGKSEFWKKAYSLSRASEDVRNMGLIPIETSLDTDLETKVVTGENVKINNDVGLSCKGDQPNEVQVKGAGV
ncbi:hypothetical protein V6N13_100335 [Hibiscus sabdariffa]